MELSVSLAKIRLMNPFYAALTLLQHRGQDAAGIITIDDENRFRLREG